MNLVSSFTDSNYIYLAEVIEVGNVPCVFVCSNNHMGKVE